MKPLLNFEKFEELKKEIKSVLIVNSNKLVTVDSLSDLYRDIIGDYIPFKDYNFCTLQDFLISIPDTVTVDLDTKNNKTYVYHVESGATRHLTSLIARQKTCKKSKKVARKPKFHSNFIDPIILTKVLLKLSDCSTNRGWFKKVDLLSEIQAIVGIHSLYTICDLNVQLTELNHILIHNDDSIHLKNDNRSAQENWLEDFIKPSTKDRLQKLIEKYPEGIWCGILPRVYRKEYRIDLEYLDLGFNDIVEFVAVLPNIFKLTKSANSSKYKVVSPKVLVDLSNDATATESTKNFTCFETSLQALPIHSSSTVSKRLIPKQVMNFQDSVDKIDIRAIPDNTNVIISEIFSPSLFWIILHRNKSKLIKLMDNLQDFYADQDLDQYKIPPIVLKPDLHIACLYSNRWHRGIIKKVELDSVLIFFYDYGTSKMYKANKLYFLHKKFSTLPAQAISCGLRNVKPAENNQWTKAVVVKFIDKTVEKEFVASIFSRDQESNSITVDLIDQVNVHITRWMISNKLAIWGSPDENSAYISPAKQYETLQKYKTKFKLLETSSDVEIVEQQEQNNAESIREALKELEKLITFTKL